MKTAKATPVLRFNPSEYHDPATSVHVELEQLVASRALLQANSGGGKSQALRALLEGTHGHVQQFVLDPEGEFGTLREKFDYVLVGKGGDVPASPKTAALLCRKLMELGASAVLDLSELNAHDRRLFVANFLTELMRLPQSLWRPLLVVIDEAHHFAPERGSGEACSTEAVIDLASRGRKRGFALIAATQRISKLHKDVAAELLNKLIGRTGLDVDVKRAGDELGFDKDSRAQLKLLSPGTFFAYGPAIANQVMRVVTPDVVTTHPKAGRAPTVLPPAPAALKSVLAQLATLPEDAKAEAESIETLRAENAKLRREARTPTPAPVDMIPRSEHLAAIAAEIEKRRELESTIRVKLPMVRQSAMAQEEQGRRLLELTEDIVASLTVVPLRLPKVAHKDFPGGFLTRDASTEAPTTEPLAKRPVVVTATGGPSAPQIRMMVALAALEEAGLETVNKETVAVMSDQSPRSSGFEKNLSTLRTRGLIDYVSGDVVLTPLGRANAHATGLVRTISTRQELHAAWERTVSRPQWLMLDALIRAYPDDVGRAELAGLSNQSQTSSGYEKNLSTLRSLKLLDYRPGKRVVATDLLFPRGLAR